jgi:hypothetical protein
MRRTRRGDLRLIRSRRSQSTPVYHQEPAQRPNPPGVTPADIQLRCELLTNIALKVPDRISGLLGLIDIAAKSHGITQEVIKERQQRTLDIFRGIKYDGKYLAAAVASLRQRR